MNTAENLRTIEELREAIDAYEALKKQSDEIAKQKEDLGNKIKIAMREANMKDCVSNSGNVQAIIVERKATTWNEAPLLQFCKSNGYSYCVKEVLDKAAFEKAVNSKFVSESFALNIKSIPKT